MDLHLYRNSQDRWYDLRAAARDRGAVLAVNAVTLDELVKRITPGVRTATSGQRLAILETAARELQGRTPELLQFTRYAYDAIGELKGAGIRPSDLRTAGSTLLADILDQYDGALNRAGLQDPQDRRISAASRVREGSVTWLERFERIVLHAIYDLTEAEFILIQSIIERLPDGGEVVLFNTTANVKPTQFAEWTWQRFLRDESLAEKTFPEFCRASHPGRAVLEKLFVFDPHDPLPADDSLHIVEASGRYKEAEHIGGGIADILAAGGSPGDIAVVVRHIETYGEMLEDVFTRYGIPHRFDTAVPLLRVPFIKYWLALLDLVTGERNRDDFSRVMSSAYFSPRLSPKLDVERILESIGYIDRRHLPASALAARKNSPLTAEFGRLEDFLDGLEGSESTVASFLNRLQPRGTLTDRDLQAWRVLSEELHEADGISGVLSFAAFRKLASEIAGIRTISRAAALSVAPGIPAVEIMSPHSLGYRQYKWIFAPGFADGEFPARSTANPLLPDEAIEIINAGIRPRRLMTSRDRNRREPLYLFVILDSASHGVTLTYPGSTLEGETIYPSVYVGEIVRHYEKSPVVRPSPGVPSARRPLPRGEGEWLCAVADEWRAGTLRDERAEELLGKSIIERARLESKSTGRADIGRGVLPLDGQWHPSELNSLSSCPFVFLARHRLKLRASEIPDFEVPVLEIGIFAHDVLRDFHAQPVPGSIEEAQIRMNDTIDRRLAAADVSGQGAYSVFDPSLWKIRRRQLVLALNQYVNFAVRDAQAGFETLPQYLDSPLPQAPMGSAILGGKPDHVAVHRTGGRVDAIRIDDFKYSAASGNTAKQLKQSFQIPIYAWLALQALGAEGGTRVEGRYLLLRSPENPVVSHPIDEAVFDEVRLRIGSLLDKVNSGTLHPDPAERQTCQDCHYRRLCRMYGA